VMVAHGDATEAAVLLVFVTLLPLSNYLCWQEFLPQKITCIKAEKSHSKVW